LDSVAATRFHFSQSLGNEISLLLVPEIGLTPQLTQEIQSYISAEVDVWHSNLSPTLRKRTFRRILEQKVKVLLGTRSAIMTPVENLGLIIVDEEHDSSYKQDEGVSYNARDMAITRASLENIPINLVTSIPSIETYSNIVNKKYHVTKLTKRYREASLPNIEIINLRSEVLNKGSWIANKTISKVNQYLNKGDQILIHFTYCFVCYPRSFI
jgi:primosomal protein N' (replication factor Y)